MIVSLIVAMARDGLIGRESGIPWHLPRDLRRFRRLTLGKPIVMGRRTFEAIGRPLDRRLNIVLTRDADYPIPAGCRLARSKEEALAIAGDELARSGRGEVMVIGGGSAYRAFLPSCDRIYLTTVSGDFSGDAFFPIEGLDPSEWDPIAVETEPADEANPHESIFQVLHRRGPGPTADG